MTNKNEKPSWLAGFTEEEMDEISKFNFESFCKMQQELVKKRKSICTKEQIAESLDVTTDEIDEFEALFSEPTIRQVWLYALAVGMKIHIEVEDCWKGAENDRED